ncbi:2761_t:CDS:2, partial [Dentiscutata heterogama]
CNSDWDVWLLEKRAMKIRDEVHETNAEVHRELNKVVSKRAIEPNEESLRKKQKQLDDPYKHLSKNKRMTIKMYIHLIMNKSQLDDVYSSNYASSSFTNKSCSQQTSERGKTDEYITVKEQERRENESDHDNNHVKNLLNELQQCSEKMASLVRSFQVYCDDSVNELIRNEIMDLTPSSEFVLRYTDEDDYMQVLKEIFEPVDKLFSESAIEFLKEFFSENCTHQQWDNRLENLLKPEENPFLRKFKRFLFETLPALQNLLTFLLSFSFDVYSLLHNNPLKNYDMLEDEFINMGNQAIRAFAYRKLIMKQEENADRSDGIVYTTAEKL